MKNKLLKTFTLFLSLVMALSLVLSIITVKQAYAADTGYYYSKLTDSKQRAMYELLYSKLKNALPNDNESKYVLTLNSTDTSAELAPFSATDDFKTIFNTASIAMLYDHPEIFWIDLINGASLIIELSGSNFTLTFTFSTLQNAKTDKPKFDSYVNSYQVSGANDYEKLKKIHDDLAALITYPSENLDYPRYHTSVALIDGYGVCEGYSKAFKVLCDKAGIPCVLVSGGSYATTTSREDHMWNCVQIDGEWYAVDLTWDDQGANLYYDYFLVGKNTNDKHYLNSPSIFNVTHQKDADLPYPEITDKKYLILTQPTDQSNIPEKTTAKFEIVTTESKETQPTPPKYEYQWQVSTDNGSTWKSLTSADSKEYTGYDTTILTINNVTSAMDKSQYRCVVTFSPGNSQMVESKPAVLKVLTIEDKSVLTLTKSSDDIIKDSVFDEDKAKTYISSALDKDGNDVKSSVKITGLPIDTSVAPPKSYTLTYTLPDESKSANLTINIVDKSVLTLTKSSDNIIKDSIFDEDKARTYISSALDKDGNDVKSSVKITGLPIDTSVAPPKSYTLTYTLPDESKSANLTINIVDKPNDTTYGSTQITIGSSILTPATSPIEDPFVHNNPTATDAPTIEQPPIVVLRDAKINARNTTLNVGDDFNLMEGVTATDDGGYGSDLTDKVSMYGTINTKIPGKYSITYQVKGANGNLVSKAITVTVKDTIINTNKCK